MARTALGGTDLPFAWQASAWTFMLRGGRGSCGTGLDAARFCVACMALGDIDLHFAWQAWHLATSTFLLRGQRGTWRHRPSFCVASAAWRFGDMDVHVAGRAWQLWHWACDAARLCVAGVAFGNIDLRFAWQARR